jgi:hypothetical protein
MGVGIVSKIVKVICDTVAVTILASGMSYDESINALAHNLWSTTAQADTENVFEPIADKIMPLLTY